MKRPVTDALMKLTGREIPEKIKSGNDMWRYCCYYQNAYPDGLHIMNQIEESLENDEYVICCFNAYRIGEEIRSLAFYAFTEKRVIFGGENIFDNEDDYLKSIEYKNIFSIKRIEDTIAIRYTDGEERCFCKYDASLEAFESKVLPLMQVYDTKEKQRQRIFNTVKELRKLKMNFEESRITEIEYQEKKKALLDL